MRGFGAKGESEGAAREEVTLEYEKVRSLFERSRARERLERMTAQIRL